MRRCPHHILPEFWTSCRSAHSNPNRRCVKGAGRSVVQADFKYKVKEYNFGTVQYFHGLVFPLVLIVHYFSPHRVSLNGSLYLKVSNEVSTH